MNTKLLLLASVFLSILTSASFGQVSSMRDARKLTDANGDLTAVILHDIFSPPIASRIYTYANIAAYEGIRLSDTSYLPLTTQLHGFDTIPTPVANRKYDFAVVGIRAFYATAKALVFSEANMEEAWEKQKNKFSAEGVADSVLANSVELGNRISAAILKRTKKDRYIQTRTLPRYKYSTSPGQWNPTPPDYAEGLEPYWNRIATMVMDSASQFMPARPIPFDSTSGSPFMEQVHWVYRSGSSGDSGQSIARYWDDNPFATIHQGHFSLAVKKVTPGGHWMGITAIALLETKSDLNQAAAAYALVSLSVFDGFIACWDEKYRSSYVRPITVINALVDENWKSLIQTPPFPEYTSGHSVISGAAASVLSDLFGDSFAFTDTLETLNDLPTRTFPSFQAAAQEASISRYFGGIHFPATLKTSSDQGRKIGEYIVRKIRLKSK